MSVNGEHKNRRAPREKLKAARLARHWSQDQAAANVGVDRKTYQRWESGQTDPHPQGVEMACRAFGLTAWELGLLDTNPPVESEISSVNTQPQREQVEGTSKQLKTVEDWGESPHMRRFYGREQELATLKQWILEDSCQLITIFGMGGIGKTTLSFVLAQQVKDAFSYIFWRSLQNTPSLDMILQDCIQCLSDQQQTVLPEDTNKRISLLMEYLRERRCLLVLDNLESILQDGSPVGHYREGYEGYGRLIQRIGEGKHRGCLLVTSREKPREIAFLESGEDSSLVCSLHLRGLDSQSGSALLFAREVYGSEDMREALIHYYAGNPLALRLVSQLIREVFHGDIAEFLRDGKAIFSDIRDVLDQQWERLSPFEQTIMFWLAINREPVSLKDLQEDILTSPDRQEVQDTLRSLQRRALVESSTAGFTLQNVIMEYVTDRIVSQVQGEIESGNLAIFHRHALIKALTKDYVRESQIRLILFPIAERLIESIGRTRLKELFKRILADLRGKPVSTGYAAGNILNILIRLGWDLAGYDFSHLPVRQAYLQGAALSDVNFAHADLTTSVFTDTFSSILSVAFSPDGNLLAAGTTNGDIRLWQVPSGIPLHTFQRHTEWAYAVAFSPDGRVLVSSAEDGTIQRWDVSTGEHLNTFQGHENRVRSVVFSPDGRRVASGSDDGTVRLWDIATNRVKILTGHTNWVKSVAFSPDGSMLASGSEDRLILLWDAHRGYPLKILRGHTDWIRSVAFSPDEKLLASGSDDHTVQIWDRETGQARLVLEGHTNRVNSVAFSPDGKLLASGSDDKTIRVWNPQSGQLLKTLLGHADRVWCVSFHPESNLLASGSHDQSVRLWDTGTGQLLRTLWGYANPVRSVVFSPDGNTLASSNHDHSIKFWNISEGHVYKILRGHTGAVYTTAFSSDGNLLASGGDDQIIRLWRVHDGQLLQKLSGHASWISSVAFHPSRNLLVSAGDDHAIWIWNFETGRFYPWHDHTNLVWTVVFSPDGQLLASGSDDCTVRLREIPSGKTLKVLSGCDCPVRTIAFNPNGQLLASGSDDKAIRFWDVSTGQVVRTLQGHTGRVWAVAFNSDGSLLASGSDDLTVCLWNVATGELLRTLHGHTRVIYSLAFHPRDSILASSDNDGVLIIWNAETGECIHTLRSNRPYERMNISEAEGLSDVQRSALKDLGAIEEETC